MEIKTSNIKNIPIYETTIFLIGDSMERELKGLLFDNENKDKLIKAYIIQFLTTLTNDKRQNKPLLKSLDKITTFNKLLSFDKSNKERDNKKITLLTLKRSKELHSFAVNNKISDGEEKEIIKEVLSLSQESLIRARNYGFSVIQSNQETINDNLHDIYFYQYATIRWLRELKKETNKEIKKILLINETLTPNERIRTDDFIKKCLPLFIDNLEKADLTALFKSFSEAENEK